MENIRLLQVCSRGSIDLQEYIKQHFPKLASVSKMVQTSSEALQLLPESGPIKILTSNWFHGKDIVGADGKSEDLMTGNTLAGILKSKNREAKVYLYAEHITHIEDILDGAFQRDTKTGAISETLNQYLRKWEDEL